MTKGKSLFQKVSRPIYVEGLQRDTKIPVMAPVFSRVTLMFLAYSCYSTHRCVRTGRKKPLVARGKTGPVASTSVFAHAAVAAAAVVPAPAPASASASASAPASPAVP